jgi:hypothetical protein
MPLIRSLMDKLSEWIGRSVQDVPAEIAACEFDCSRPHCYGDELEDCPRRIREAEAGEPIDRHDAEHGDAEAPVAQRAAADPGPR